MSILDEPHGLFDSDGKTLSASEIKALKTNLPTLISSFESRSLKLSTITREVHRGTDSCILCRTNTDPSKIPVHPNCTCDASTQDVEVGQVPSDDSHFRVMSTKDEDIVFLSESDLPATLVLDPATTGVVQIDDLRFADLARWLEKMQPYLEGANQVLTILSETESNEDVSVAAEFADVAAEESESALQAITGRRVWFGIASEVAGL